MTSPTPDLAAVVERLEKVERHLRVAKRRNRWLLAAGGLAVVGLVLAWTLANTAATAQAQEAKVIRANQFILEDETGKPRAVLRSRKEGGAYLALVDETGKPRAVLSVEQDGAALQLRNENHRLRMALGLSQAGPGLYLSDENGKLRAGLAVSESGPMLQMYDRTGKTTWARP